MLAKEHRFHGSRAVRAVYKKGRAVRSRRMGARFTTGQQGFRVSVIVSRKVSKSAVVRNRIRRRLYELIRKDFSSLLKGVHANITVYDASLAVAPHSELKRELESLLAKMQSHRETPKSRGIVEGERD